MVASGTRGAVNEFASEDLLSHWLLVTLEAPKEKIQNEPWTNSHFFFIYLLLVALETL